MDRETFTKGLEITLSKTNMPNGNGIDLENICKDFALLAYDEALILHSVVVVPKGTLVCDNCETKLKARYHKPNGIFCIKCKDLTN